MGKECTGEAHLRYYASAYNRVKTNPPVNHQKTYLSVHCVIAVLQCLMTLVV